MKSVLAPLYDIFRLPAFESPESEEAYWAWEDSSKLALRKLFLIVAIATFASIGLLDSLTAGESAALLMKIRIVTVAILAIIYVRFAGDRTPSQRDRLMYAFALTVGISIILMTLFAPRPAADFYPLLLSATMVFGSCLVVPRFSTMARMCITTNVLYWPTVYFSQTSLPAIYANLFIMTVTTFSVVVGAFAREQLERRQTLYQVRLAEAREDAIAARDSAIQASQAKSHLLANVSHELRTPMNAILGFSEVMKNEMFGAIEQKQYREYVSDIHFAGNLLQANINDLLDLSRLEVDKMGWTDSWSSLAEIVERTVHTCERDAATAGVRLSSRLENKALAILCDPERTAQILINLVTNAIKFSERGSEVTISSATVDGSTALSITDQGCGISAEHIRQIFEPFRQVDTNSLTTRKGGMGLGLSIVSGLVKKLNGKLTIESELGEGTTATVMIPAERSSLKWAGSTGNDQTEAELSVAAG